METIDYHNTDTKKRFSCTLDEFRKFLEGKPFKKFDYKVSQVTYKYE